MIDLPDFSTPLRSIAGSVAKMAGLPLGRDPAAMPNDLPLGATQDRTKDAGGKSVRGGDAPGKEPLGKDTVGKREVQGHA